jgi:NADPH-dependent ferric siderophore reductase
MAINNALHPLEDNMVNQASVRPPRRRPPLRPVQVVAVTRLAPRTVQVFLAGNALEGFELAGPAQHVKLSFPAAGQDTRVLANHPDHDHGDSE